MRKSFGDRSFSVAAPTLWDALPASLRNIDSILLLLSLLHSQFLYMQMCASKIKRQMTAFRDLYWKNKTYKLMRSIGFVLSPISGAQLLNYQRLEVECLLNQSPWWFFIWGFKYSACNQPFVISF